MQNKARKNFKTNLHISWQPQQPILVFYTMHNNFQEKGICINEQIQQKYSRLVKTCYTPYAIRTQKWPDRIKIKIPPTQQPSSGSRQEQVLPERLKEHYKDERTQSLTSRCVLVVLQIGTSLQAVKGCFLIGLLELSSINCSSITLLLCHPRYLIAHIFTHVLRSI